jgi:predicted solute-binding protein
MKPPERKPRVCAVSYLNTVPLVWGLAHGAGRRAVDLSFAVPSICAERVADGAADLGLLPVIEMERRGFGYLPGVGIGYRGAVRSILLISRVEPGRIRSLAVDTGSRTSVELARIILAYQFGALPVLLPMPPVLNAMLDAADAALIIGDAALSLNPDELDYPCLDLGAEWLRMTGLPFVFALWSGPDAFLTPELERVMSQSAREGIAALDAIVTEESVRRGFSEQLVRSYFERNVQLLLEDTDYAGMRRYLELAASLEPALVVGAVAR